jgi:hypothetical protein
MRVARLENLDTLPLNLDLGPVDAVRDLERQYAPSDILMDEIYGHKPERRVGYITFAALIKQAGLEVGPSPKSDDDICLRVDAESLAQISVKGLRDGLRMLHVPDNRLKRVRGVQKSAIFTDFEYTQFPRADQLVAAKVVKKTELAQAEGQDPLVTWSKQYRSEMHAFLRYRPRTEVLLETYESLEKTLKEVLAAATERDNLRLPKYGAEHINAQRRIADAAIQEAVAVSLISYGYTDEERLVYHRAVESLLYRQGTDEDRMDWWRKLSRMTLAHTVRKRHIVQAAQEHAMQRLGSFVTGLPLGIDRVA